MTEYSRSSSVEGPSRIHCLLPWEPILAVHPMEPDTPRVRSSFYHFLVISYSWISTLLTACVSSCQTGILILTSFPRAVVRTKWDHREKGGLQRVLFTAPKHQPWACFQFRSYRLISPEMTTAYGKNGGPIGPISARLSANKWDFITDLRRGKQEWTKDRFCLF